MRAHNGASSLSRRRFLALGVGGAATQALTRWPAAALTRFAPAAATALRAPVLASVADGVVTLVRPDDQLYVTFHLLNLEMVGGMLDAIDGESPSALKLVFGPQHAEEESIDLVAGDPIPTATDAMRLRAAGNSRVVVAVEPPIPFTVADLLDLADRTLLLDPRAVPPGTGTGPPSVDVTAIEVPEDIILSPGSDGRFTADAAAVTVAGVSELWRARLGRTDGGFAEATVRDPVELRAVDGGSHVDDFDRVLSRARRLDLVDATTDYGNPLYPDNEPVLASRLWFTLHGASADVAGTWNGSGTLAAWAQTVRFGRTVEVTVTERGFLAPFGHSASIVGVSERLWAVATDGTTVAVLVTQEAFVPGDVVVDYPRAHMPIEGRALPFTAVELVPPVAPIGRGEVSYTDDQGIPQTINSNVLFQLVDATTGAELAVDYVATDRAGNRVQFATETYFVRGSSAFELGVNTSLGKLRRLFNDGTAYSLDRRRLMLGGQQVAFADEAEPGSGATSKAVDELVIRLERPDPSVTKADLIAAASPAFFAAVESALVDDPVLANLSGNAFPVAVTLDQAWLDHGLGPENFGNTFLRLDTRQELPFATDGGGLMAAGLQVDVFGQDLGLSTDLAATDGEWDPVDALGDAKLLGLIDLVDLLGVIDAGGGLAGAVGLPAYTVELVQPDLLEPPTEICYHFAFEPQITSQSMFGTRVFVVTDDFAAEGISNPFSEGSSALFRVDLCVPLDGSAAGGADLEVTVRNVALQLPPGAPAMAIKFARVSYLDPPDAVGRFDFDLTDYQFVGILDVLEPIRELLQGLASDARIDIDPAVGITAEIPISTPDVNLGVVRLTDMSVGVGIFVPFPGGSTQPFTTSFSIESSIGVWLFKGSASFMVDLQPHPIGIATFKATLGMGAEIAAAGFGVSGSIGMEVAASIKYDKTVAPAGEITIGGSFSIYGSVTAWGVLGAGVRATLTLKYLVNTKLLRAKGTVIGWVMVLGFQKEWRLQVSEDFDLDNNSLNAAHGRSARMARAIEASAQVLPPADPGTFGDAYTQPDWQSYCGAFAP